MGSHSRRFINISRDLLVVRDLFLNWDYCCQFILQNNPANVQTTTPLTTQYAIIKESLRLLRKN